MLNYSAGPEAMQGACVAAGVRTVLTSRRFIQVARLEASLRALSGVDVVYVEDIRATLGVRDNNEASWTQVLDVVEFMSDATRVPILLDGDTGFGNFNSVRRLVRKLEQRGVAGACRPFECSRPASPRPVRSRLVREVAAGGRA